MKVTTPEISWHERDPIYSVDFQPGSHSIQRLASGGVDKIVRIWQMTYDSDGKGHFEFLSNLRRHTASVNVVRFSKNGELLASAGDDSTILVWKLSDVSSPSNNIFSEEDVEEDKESWVCHKTLRGHLGDVGDLCWSKDSQFLVSGSVDNSAIVWDVNKALKIAFFNDHKSYVQGVAFDPLGDFIASLSSDRSMRIFNLSSKNCVHNVSKMAPILMDDQTTPTDTKPKSFRIFHDDSLRSFFRRLEFSCDGHLLFAPTGCVEVGDKLINCSFVFVRGAFSRPALYLPSGEKATTVIRANPQLFELRTPKDFNPENHSEETPAWESHKSLFSLPYRIVFAVATDDSVFLYDSQQTMPIALMKNIHYHQISDLSWTSDGMALIIASTDGFCTIGTFDAGELGVPYTESSRRKPSTRNPVSPSRSSNNEESPAKPESSDLPFSRYSADDKDRKEDKHPEINTKLNIRRVDVKPESKNSSVKAKEDETGDSPKINTSLNIRKVKKDVTVTPAEEKKNPDPSVTDLPSEVKNMDIQDVGMGEGCRTTGRENKTKDDEKGDSPKINTSLNIRKVKKDVTVTPAEKTPEASHADVSSDVNNKMDVQDVEMVDSGIEGIEGKAKEESPSDSSSNSKEITGQGEGSSQQDGKKRIQLTTISLLD